MKWLELYKLYYQLIWRHTQMLEFIFIFSLVPSVFGFVRKSRVRTVVASDASIIKDRKRKLTQSLYHSLRNNFYFIFFFQIFSTPWNSQPFESPVWISEILRFDCIIISPNDRVEWPANERVIYSKSLGNHLTLWYCYYYYQWYYYYYYYNDNWVTNKMKS